MLPTKLGVSATLFQFWVLYDFNAVLPTVPAKTLDWCENALSSFLFKDLHIFAVLELVFDIFVWSLHPCNLPSHHGMIDKWPKYSGHFLANSNLADAEAKLPLQAQRHTKKDNNLCVFFFLLKKFWMPVSQHLCMYSRIKGRPFQITFYPVYMNLIGWNLCCPSES